MPGDPSRRLLLVMAVIVAIAGQAQRSGKLRLLVDPGNSFEFVLDHQFRMQQREVELGEGAHHFTFWAPERRMVDTTLVVDGDMMKEVLVRLPYSAEYLAWKRDLESYRNDRKLRRLVPTVLTTGALAYTVVRYFKYVEAHDQLNSDLDAYVNGVAPQSVTDLKERTIPAHKDEFRNAKTQFVLAASLTAAMAGATAYLFHRSSKRKVPEFHDTEKLRFQGLVWSPGPDGGGWMGGLTFGLATR